MVNDINKEDPHYKGEYGSIYEVNRKFPTGGVAGDFVVIDGWAHYWNAVRGTWCVNAERDSYWDELITNIIEKFKLVRGATYLGVANLDTVPTKVIGAKMYYFATVAGTYKNFDNLVVPQGINVLYSENGSSWVNTTLLEVAQELGVSTNKVVSQKAVSDKLSDLLNKHNDVIKDFAEEKTKDKNVVIRADYTPSVNGALLTDGTLKQIAGYTTTDFIDIKGVKKITASSVWSGGQGFASVILLDESKTNVLKYFTSDANIDYEIESSIAQNVRYARVMLKKQSALAINFVTFTCEYTEWNIKNISASQVILENGKSVEDSVGTIMTSIEGLKDITYTSSDCINNGALLQDGTTIPFGNWKHSDILDIPKGYTDIIISNGYSSQYLGGKRYVGGCLLDNNRKALTFFPANGTIQLKAYPTAKYVILAWRDIAEFIVTLKAKKDDANILTDNKGEKYKLSVINGELAVSPTTFRKVVVLGNSLTWHEYNTSIAWYGKDRSMASTTNETSWPYLFQRILRTKKSDAVVTGVMARNWEKAGDGNRTHEKIKSLLDAALTPDTDLIIFRTGENAGNPNQRIFESEIKELLDYCLSVSTRAQVVMCTCFWENANRDKAIINVANERNYPIIGTGQPFSYHTEMIGDYMVDSEDDEEKMLTVKDVTIHTSDVGFYHFTNYLASCLGYVDEILNELYTIEMQTSIDYTLLENVKNAGGLVTILTISAVSISVKGKSGNIISTKTHLTSDTAAYKGTATHAYTFVMPNEDVIVTLT